MDVLPNDLDMLVKALGDCSKVPVDHIDLVNHHLRCNTIEIFHYEDSVSFTAEEEEEEEIHGWGPIYSDHTDDIDRTLLLVGDLDCLIRRIMQMQLLINDMREERKLRYKQVEEEEPQPKEPEKEPIPLRCQEPKKPEVIYPSRKQQQQKDEDYKDKDKLNCDEKIEIRSLQKSHHRLQCEIDEMICNFQELRKFLRNLRTQMAIENRRLRKLGASTGEFFDWTREVSKEMHVCKQRYVRLLELKLSKSEARRVIDANFDKAYKRNKTFVSWGQLRYDLRDFHSEIDELIAYADDLRKDVRRRYSILRFHEENPVCRIGGECN